MISFKDSEKEIASFTTMVHRRMHAAGAKTIAREDIFNELVVAWCKARDNFDPAAGASFKTYLYRGMQMHINRWAQVQIDAANQAPLSIDDDTKGGDSDGDLEAVIPDNRIVAADDVIIGQQARDRFIRKLSPTARLIAETLENPPDEIVREVDALRAKADLARSQGTHTTAPRTVTAAVLFELFGVDRVEIGKIYREFETARVYAAA